MTPMDTIQEALTILKEKRGDTAIAHAAMAGYLMAMADQKTADAVLKIVKGN